MENDASATRIAVLIDADNTSPKYAEAILDEVAKYGTPTIKRAYGDFSHQRLSGWSRELNARAIRPIHQVAYTTGKNSTDSGLIIDAMDLLYAGNVEAFAIVSSDSDFTGLAQRLAEAGKLIYGFGEKKTPMSLQNACTKFIRLDVLGQTDEDAEQAEEVEINLQSALVKAVNATGDDEGWTSVAKVRNHLNRTHPSFDVRSFGQGRLPDLVAAQPYLQTKGTGNQMQVQVKGRAPVKKTSKTAKKTAKKG